MTETFVRRRLKQGDEALQFDIYSWGIVFYHHGEREFNITRYQLEQSIMRSYLFEHHGDTMAALKDYLQSAWFRLDELKKNPGEVVTE